MNADINQAEETPDVEPTAGLAQMPVWLFVLVAAMAYWGMDFLDRHGGGFHPKVYEPFVSYAQLEGMQPVGPGVDLAKGRKIYTDLCSVCHGPTGTGIPNQAPPLAGSEWVLAEKPDRIIRILWNGLMGPVTVKGAEWRNVQMPNIGQAANLAPEDIAALLTFIRGNNSWGNNAAPVTAEQVAPILEAIKGRDSAWTADDLSKIPVQ
jgi:mono/diheme cytochrome c family protein